MIIRISGGVREDVIKVAEKIEAIMKRKYGEERVSSSDISEIDLTLFPKIHLWGKEIYTPTRITLSGVVSIGGAYFSLKNIKG